MRLWGISVSEGFQCQSMVALDAAQQLPRTSAGDRGPPLPARSWLTNNSRSPGQARQTMAASTGVVARRPAVSTRCMNCRSAKYRPMGQATPTTTYLALAEGADDPERPGGLYLAAQMSRRMHLSAGQRVLDLGAVEGLRPSSRQSPGPGRPTRSRRPRSLDAIGVGAGDRHSTHRVARQARMAPWTPCGRVDRGWPGAYRPLKRGGRFSMNARRPSS